MSICHHLCSLFFFFNDTATTEIYTLSLHDALPISPPSPRERPRVARRPGGRWLGAAMFLPAILYVVAIIGVPFLMAFLYAVGDRKSTRLNSSHDQISYAVFCLKKKNNTTVKLYDLS